MALMLSLSSFPSLLLHPHSKRHRFVSFNFNFKPKPKPAAAATSSVYSPRIDNLVDSVNIADDVTQVPTPLLFYLAMLCGVCFEIWYQFNCLTLGVFVCLTLKLRSWCHSLTFSKFRNFFEFFTDMSKLF